LSRFQLLTIDDLGVERGTDTMNEMVYAIIDSRYRSGLPLIVTTNTTSAELKNPTDIHKARIYSRLLEMCIPIEVTGCDRRKEKLKSDFSEFKELLGL
jgi:DNA replication protein DnaC